MKSNLNIILCVGESYSTYKTKKSIKFIKSQLQVLTKKTIKNTIIALRANLVNWDWQNSFRAILK